MRIAVVRGANLNPWELANYRLDGHEVVAFGARRGAFDAHGLAIDRRRLASPADVVGRLPAIAQGAVGRFAGDSGYLAGLERALDGFDIAHTAELGSPCSRQALRARDHDRVRRVVATVWENIALPAAPNRFIARRSEIVARGVDRFLAITERARDHLLFAGVPAERIEVFPMGVDLTRFTPRQAAPDGPAPLRVLTVCRLVAEKGVEDLVVAARLLAERGVDVVVTFAGSGPAAGHLADMAARLGVADRVVFTGSVPYDEIPRLHAEADVFVLASAPRATWQEQFGFAVVEAMASGLPVLAGDSGSLDEVVGDPQQLVTPQHPDRLADALQRLATDPARRAALGAANRASAERRYDRDLVAGRIAAFYEAALSAPSASSRSAQRAPMARQS